MFSGGKEVEIKIPSNQLHQLNKNHHVELFQFSVAFHIKTSHLIWTVNPMTGFSMKCNAANSETYSGSCKIHNFFAE